MNIMVFLHGTVLMHSNALGKTRQERVRQVIEGDDSLHDFASYVPVGNAAQKLQSWSGQGAKIGYLSSHTKIEEVEKDRSALGKYAFPEGQIFYRRDGESYSDVAESFLPDILIEDDCESIGGEIQMTYPHLPPDRKATIKSIVVKEFGGIDHLPQDILALMRHK
jgi:hypothetical protein